MVDNHRTPHVDLIVWWEVAEVLEAGSRLPATSLRDIPEPVYSACERIRFRGLPFILTHAWHFTADWPNRYLLRALATQLRCEALATEWASEGASFLVPGDFQLDGACPVCGATTMIAHTPVCTNGHRKRFHQAWPVYLARQTG